MKPNEIQTILAAVDGSDAGYRAVSMAATLAGKFGCPLILLHVIRDQALPRELEDMIEYEQINESRIEILKNSGQMILDRAKDIANECGVTRVSCKMSRGDPADSIVRFAEKNNVSLIILGRRGLNDIRALLLGSVSRKVTNLTSISCMTVN